MLSAVVCSVMAPLAVMTLASEPQVDVPDSQAATAIEQALVERACSGSISDDAHHQCFGARLLSLRTDFGRNLSRLSAPDRKKLDAACNRFYAPEGREAYLDCLGAQLVVLHNRRNRATAAATRVASPASPSASAPAAVPVPAASQRFSRWSSTRVTGAAVASVLAVADLMLLVVVRRRRARLTCRGCGARISESGDVCSACRRQAAELRHAAAERAHQRKLKEEQARRQREQEAEQRGQRAREEEEARLRQQELVRRREENMRRHEEEARHREEEEARHRRQAAAAAEADKVFDPYTVLGVARDTSLEEIRMAYLQARLKYDLDLVAQMGVETERHFREKAQAVDRAYQMLADV